MDGSSVLCACGCGQATSIVEGKPNTFVYTHHLRCRKMSDSHKAKVAAANRQRWDDELIPGHKKCPVCQLIRPRHDFPKRSSGGSSSRCFDCQAVSKYGISSVEFNKILASQGGVCAICESNILFFSRNKDAFNKLCVDHDHETGEIRGLLCLRCNVGLGVFRDSSSLLVRAAEYLDGYRRDLEFPDWVYSPR